VVKIDISFLIDRLENLLNKSRRMPLSSGVIVNRDECLEIIDQMRVTIPQQIAEAKRIQHEREQILALAQEEGQRLVQRADEEAEQFLNERGLLEEAQKRSEAIIEESRRQAEETMRGADNYAITVLGQLEDQLIALQTTIRNGLEILQQEVRTTRPPVDADPEAHGLGVEIDSLGEVEPDS
jgi:cell division septum initiation protein DivIVA